MCFSIFKVNDEGWGQELVPITPGKYINMIGFSVYMFEGVGISIIFL